MAHENSKRVERMLNLQASNNLRVNQNWMNQNYNWVRAIRMELFELFEHLNWKWWINKKFDSKEVYIEVVDIWHFILSLHLEGRLEQDVKEYYNHIPDKIINVDEELIIYEVEKAMEETLVSKTLSLEMFEKLCYVCGVTKDSLYKLYIGKAVLNEFRQENGYKVNKYLKWWFGKEDNTHLIEILKDLNVTSEELDFEKKLKLQLNSLYKEATKDAV